ncbi:MAG: site-specific integrase [Leptospirales bacterium]
MASIYKRAPYQWQALIRRKGFETQARVFNTKAEAEAWAQVTESEMTRGVFVSRKEAENTTLSEALDPYLKEITEKKKGSYQESRRIENLKIHRLGKRFLATIQGKDIAEYRDERLESVSPATVRRELVILSHLFTVVSKEWGMSGLGNPVQSIRLPSGRGVSRDLRKHPGEEKALLDACEEYGGDLPHVVRFALETAMRRGEIAGLTWDDVDLKKKTATLLNTKIGEKRIVSLSAEAIRILSVIPRRIDGRVFGYTDPHSIIWAFIHACKKAGIAGLTFHDLRHEATSRLFELGLSAEKVKEITGHKTDQMLPRYTHLKAEDIAEEIDKLKKERSGKTLEAQAKSWSH